LKQFRNWSVSIGVLPSWRALCRKRLAVLPGCRNAR
jgi:hypothetical protein